MPPLVVRPEREDGALLVQGPEVAFRFACPDIEGDGADAAAIVALPIAMRLGRPLRVEAAVSARLLAGLAAMAEVWSVWRPDLFSAVPVAAAEAVERPSGIAPLEPEVLMAYSGGIDSTHALRRLDGAYGARPDLLTVLGMDYPRSDPDRFARLVEKTRPFREAVSGRHLVVDSDAASVMRRFDVDSYLGFGFQVFACLHLFGSRYGWGAIASDYAAYQEVLVGPRGTFTATNHHFGSEALTILTLDPDLTRGDKVEALAADPLALSALSFCKDRAVRPENCGVCSKCLRTKAMFFAATGTVPPIFRDPSLDLAAMEGLDLSRAYERVFAQDMRRLARRHGREAAFAPLLAGLPAQGGPASLRHRLYKARMMLSSRLGLR